ncbi:MAG: F0F1 ATP synthase subunit epsilon [Phycisphaerales bacterium]
MAESKNTFKCVIISPSGKLFDAFTVGVNFIANDGSVGVLAHHMPMICALGLGIMEIHLPPSDMGESQKKYALIDGGFALVHSNMVNIIANDAVSAWDVKREKIEILIERDKKKLKELPESSDKYAQLLKKNMLLENLLTLHSA